MRTGWFVAAAALVLVGPGCGEEETLAPPCSEIDGAGVPAAPLCDDDTCTDAVSCASVAVADSQAALDDALGSAAPGACIALAPGSYGDVTLPPGVSLLGKGAGYVHVARVIVSAGSGSVLRGLDVQGGVVVLPEAEGARIESSCVTSAGNGIDIGAGSEVTVVDTHVQNAAEYGIRAFDPNAVELTRTLVTGAGGPGVWAECLAGCECAAPPDVTLTQVKVLEASLVGMALRGVRATVEGVAVRDTRRRDFSGGGGLILGGCTDITADDVEIRISDTEPYGAFGIFSDGASGRLGSAEAKGIIIVGGRPGLWIMDSGAVGTGLSLEGLDIQDSHGLGLGIGLETRGIIIVGGKIGGTGGETIPLAGGGMGSVGDGLLWQAGAQVTIDGLALEGSARQSVLIDGAVGDGSSISSMSLSGGDEETGILQQGVADDDAAPEMGADAPVIERNTNSVLGVAAQPETPEAI